MGVDATGNVYVADTFNSPHSQCAADTTFPAISVSQTSSSQNVYLEINQTLPISSFNVPPPEGGTHEYADGTVTGCPTGSAIAAGTICTIPVTFSPTFLGVRGVPLIVATTSSGEFKFGLTGVGIAPQTALLPGIIQTMAGNGKAHSATPMVLRQLPA